LVEHLLGPRRVVVERLGGGRLPEELRVAGRQVAGADDPVAAEDLGHQLLPVDAQRDRLTYPDVLQDRVAGTEWLAAAGLRTGVDLDRRPAVRLRLVGLHVGPARHRLVLRRRETADLVQLAAGEGGRRRVAV